jgi:serine/threonine protein phosphatase PrpC
VHIGDTRAYLVRDGEVFQITNDHTLVQSLLDDGKITAADLVALAMDGDAPDNITCIVADVVSPLVM